MKWTLALLWVLWGPVALAEGRVAAAQRARGAAVAEAFRAAGVAWPPGELYLRAFKQERELEVWAGAAGKPLVKVKTYPFCAASGELGPKRREGDLQVPEGFYVIDLLNPWSQFHLSLRVSYPNSADRKLGDARHPGSNIFIHGGCASIGCIAIEDEPIEELYLMVRAARGKRRDVPVHIFPRRLDTAGLTLLEQHPEATLDRMAFWRSLQPGYILFEQTRRPPRVKVDGKTGEYRVSAGRGSIRPRGSTPPE